MIRSTWLLVLVALACQSPDLPITKQAPIIHGQWRYISDDGDKGEDLNLETSGSYTRTKWFADLVHEEKGCYDIQASRYRPQGWVILFYPAPDTIAGSVWNKNPYGYCVTEIDNMTLGLMISSRVNPSSSESVIGERVQVYHPRQAP